MILLRKVKSLSDLLVEVENDVRKCLSESSLKSVHEPQNESQTGTGLLTQFKIEKVENAFGSKLLRINFTRKQTCLDLERFMDYLLPRVLVQLRTYLKARRGLKCYLVVECEYEKVVPSATDTEPVKIGYLKTENIPLRHVSMLDTVTGKMTSQIAQRHINFLRDVSGLRLRNVQRASLFMAQYNPLLPSGVDDESGSGYVPLPAFLANKKAIVNVENGATDTRCFAFALLSALHPAVQNPSRKSYYVPYFAEHPCFDRISYPVQLANLADVEKAIEIPFNVFSFYDDEGLARYPIYISRINADIAIDLLYFDGHYAWIKHFSRFMFDITKNNNAKFFCKRCLGHFTKESILAVHKKCCRGDDVSGQIYTMPPEGTVLTFRNSRYMQLAPFLIYADFETLVKTTEDSTNITPSTAYQSHTPISVGMKLVSLCTDIQLAYEDYTGYDVTEFFLHRMLDYEKICKDYLFDEKRMIISDVDQELFDVAAECYVCEKPFTTKNPKVRDHDHVTGLYRGAAHRSCNLLLRRTIKIPVFIHNFRGYDSHLIMGALGFFKHLNITVIGQGMEKYLTLTWSEHLIFKDSYQFCQASLERLVECLMRGGRAGFRHMIEAFEPKYPSEAVDLLLRKGVYPYDFMNSKSRLLLPALPPREAFNNRLRASVCSEEDYAHAQKVWSTFECKTMQDYHDIYLKTDVLLLADVFEAFRNVCMSNYGLDPSHYVSAPHLTWDAMMRMTHAELQLLNDPAMFDMINEGLRGGMCMISHRHAEANNKYMGELYDPTKPSSYIVYLDANNLYGLAMSQPMPHSGFGWMESSAFSSIDWLRQTDDQPIGYFVECDLGYPTELHDYHNDYPLAPERVTISRTMLSVTAQTIRAKYDVSHNNTTKLVTTLFDKKRYTCHYRNLRFYLQQGMILGQVYRVLAFFQSRWLAPYIQKNQDLRAETTDEFEKKFFKDMNNCIYGKTCENLTRRSDVRIVTDGRKCEELLRKPHCTGFRIFTEHIAAVQLKKVQCLINKPTYVGFTVLEVSKLHMYEFYYNFMKKVLYPREGQARLLFTDTDSLCFHIQTEDVYADFFAHKELFDFSNYPKDSPFYTAENKMVIGKMKDETAGKQIKEFVGLRPKMYSYVYITKTAEDTGPFYKEVKKAKGISHTALQDIHHEQYKQQLFTPTENRVTVRRIGQKLHRVFTYESKKRGICAFDDKRFILPDRISTLAYGHWRVAAEHKQRINTTSDLFSDDDAEESETIVVDARGATEMGIALRKGRAGTAQTSLSGRDPKELFNAIRDTHRRCTSLTVQQGRSAAVVADVEETNDAEDLSGVISTSALIPASNLIHFQRFSSYVVDDDED